MNEHATLGSGQWMRQCAARPLRPETNHWPVTHNDRSQWAVAHDLNYLPATAFGSCPNDCLH